MTAKKSLSIKGIAIVLMLFHHLFTWAQADYIPVVNFILPNHLTIEGFFGVFGKLCVTLYLFLSGYGFSCKYIDRTCGTSSMSEFVMSAWKVYRKYLLVLVIFLPYGFISKIYNYDIPTVLANFTGFNTSYNQECWFLFVYILIVIFILPLLVKTQNTISGRRIALLSLALIVFGYGLRFVIVHSSIAWFRDTRIFFNLYYFMLSQFAFVVGWLCKRWGFFEKTERIHIHWIIWLILMGILVVIKVYCPGGMLLDTLLTAPFVALSLKVLKHLDIIDRIFTILGRHSTYMWMTHTFFAYYYASAFIYSFKYPLLITIVLIIVSMLTAYIMEKIETIIINFWRRIKCTV